MGLWFLRWQLDRRSKSYRLLLELVANDFENGRVLYRAFQRFRSWATSKRNDVIEGIERRLRVKRGRLQRFRFGLRVDGAWHFRGAVRPGAIWTSRPGNPWLSRATEAQQRD